jgi:hypothetical protein
MVHVYLVLVRGSSSCTQAGVQVRPLGMARVSGLRYSVAMPYHLVPGRVRTRVRHVYVRTYYTYTYHGTRTLAS